MAGSILLFSATDDISSNPFGLNNVLIFSLGDYQLFLYLLKKPEFSMKVAGELKPNFIQTFQNYHGLKTLDIF